MFKDAKTEFAQLPSVNPDSVVVGLSQDDFTYKEEALKRSAHFDLFGSVTLYLLDCRKHGRADGKAF